ncbi:hypothetical protein [Chroococcidiopsis sp. TS-821]|uniref:hypothetical protein n=1 Tax=Chroococcidiopsis sp. TS-821 TaxID=1378066 RepID=UPI000D404D81|nr:hypothetical protein [Chroococcidiopsis sp. TS-821]PPS45002.1 hypothetical protein B1A85_01620 [Chroococcidiopsis sp. TS-821]
MRNIVRSLTLIHNSPLSTLTQQWEGITVEYSCMNAVSEFDFAMPKTAISVAFAPHDRVTWSVDAAVNQMLRNYSFVLVKPQLGNKLLDTLKLNQFKDCIEESLAQKVAVADVAAVVHSGYTAVQ